MKLFPQRDFHFSPKPDWSLNFCRVLLHSISDAARMHCRTSLYLGVVTHNTVCLTLLIVFAKETDTGGSRLIQRNKTE